ncbi:MAG: tetratricopeptide repeat protein [Methyloversatilis discipulorum]|uniref:tetratricopeptide repeat protein n=1 Tax=Methyloversatilis discipulorum TaxID=1119528 RepID=UPI0026F154E0|nr:tetratricopeptide repeat protein [Methyloversatilis discipulorum]MBT9516655.1 tetratricopeptide repeat protein [Methyloversatilis discipulorum]
MLRRSSYAAASLERPRLVAPHVLLGIGALVGVLLVLLYPYQALVQYTINATRGDTLTVVYLRNLLRTDPRNPELRLALVRQSLARRDYEQARADLAPLLASDIDRDTLTEARWVDWTLYESELLSTAPWSSRHVELEAQLPQRLRDAVAIDGLNEINRMSLVQRALSRGQALLALDLIATFQRDGSAVDPRLYGQAAAELLGQGEYEGAARMLLLQRSREPDAAVRRQLFLQALRTLQSGNLLDLALDTAEREIGELANDTEVLYYLVTLARAANRPDAAARYAKQMLKLSLQQQLRRAMLAQTGFDAQPWRVATGAGPDLPFDDKIYTLGYEAFIGNRQLDDAQRVAASAVRQAPDDMKWRERLATVSEWAGKPQEALDQWLVLAQRTGREDAWDAVLRLAPGLLDDEALLPALQHRLRRSPGDMRLLGEIVAAYERQGRPREGIAFLQKITASSPTPQALKALADLAERAGDIDLALATLARLDTVVAPEPARASRRAALLIVRSRFDDAMQALESAKAVATDADRDYWRLYSSLAMLLQDDDRARAALERVTRFDDADAFELADLIELLTDVAPLAAAREAERGWRRYGDTPWLMRTLDLYVFAGRPQDVGRIIGDMSTAQLAKAERVPLFLQMRAQWHQSAGRRDLAFADFSAALTLVPDSADVRSALLWLLIDGNEVRALRDLLLRKEQVWAQDEALHDALAAAWQALSRPQVALDRYMLPRFGRKRGDFLWMMNVADALEQNQEVDRAWRLRQTLWAQERPRLGELAAGDIGQLQRLARVRLARAQQPGDASHALLREVLRLDRAPDGQWLPAARELALSWFIDRGEYDAVRGFLWHQYGRALNRPLWADITAALGQGDVAAVGALLETWDERLPRYDRVNSARLVGDLRRAQSAAFETMDAQRDDAPLHLQLSDAMLDYAHRFDLDIAQRELGGIDERQAGATLDMAIAPDLRMSFEFGSISRSRGDNTQFSAVPGESSYLLGKLAWAHDDGTTRITLGQRDGFETIHPFAIEREQRIDNRLSATAGIGTDMPATENLGLRAAGMRDQIDLRASYRVSRYDRVGLQLGGYRYRAQNGLSIGSGRLWQAELVHSIRTELPDLEVSAYVAGYRFSPSDIDLADARAVDIKQRLFAGSDADVTALRPQSFNLQGLRLTHNIRLLRDYTKALRPFGSIGVSNNSVAGAGYDVSFGVAGSLLGTDHFSLSWRQDKGGGGIFARTTEFALHYRLFF